ncbi:SGNH/GDSL hydrolase family protein [Acinetobacter sp. SK-43]|uniref:GDSL-type esterase/lipase family protein n=1 Tax=Acinetobacter sp. SK-43 TaxID=2785295 RepID=UPI00188AF753|nr:GDSL-type esterase/lipase family protein [Acinetobacter sp. SK-43]MBF4456783.1 SGNH/GDSL hydrolase family protein [Acinetobacter sp. SK-43]
MANIQGQKKWSDVRLLETHELARGGTNGNLNEQAIALADRTEFLNQEKASKSEIVQGVFEFGTYAEFNAVKVTLPLNCSIVINEENNTGTGSWGIGNNRWNGSILQKSQFDPYEKSVSFSNSNAMFKQKTYAVAADFNDLTSYGFHSFLNGTVWNNSTNKPEQNAQWGHLLVLPTQGSVLTQIAFMGNVTKTFAMRLRTDTGAWQAWGYFHSFDKIVELIKADFNSYLKPQRLSASKNLFDSSTVTAGKEIYSNGALQDHAQGAVSGLIYCFGKSSLYVSGLQSNAANRYYRFLDKAGQVVSVGYFASGVNEGKINVPDDAHTFQIAVKQRISDALNISNVQIEYGSEKTAYTAFIAGEATHINGMALFSPDIKMNSVAGSKNLFDKSRVQTGFEIYSDGSIKAQTSSIISDIISVKGLSNITISGLVANPEIVRYCRFLDASNNVLSVTSIAQNAIQATIAVPVDAAGFQFSIKQRSTATPDLNIIQLESGTNVTTYEAYVRGFNTLNNIPVAIPAQSTAQASRAFGAKYLMFGDSITQTSNVDTGDVTSSTYRSNWPKFAKDQLKMGGFKNYARSGASFLETGPSQTDWQKISYQVQTAITNAENPDVIVLACGTNDANIKLGTYDTAMSKAIADLDRTYTAEAMRWALYKIKENFPNAVCFYCTQLQRADVETTDRDTANNLMVKLAKRYGFNIIDCMNESGIIKDFEIWQANGRYLSDGLHPNIAGQQVQANLIVSNIIERMNY